MRGFLLTLKIPKMPGAIEGPLRSREKSYTLRVIPHPPQTRVWVKERRPVGQIEFLVPDAAGRPGEWKPERRQVHTWVMDYFKAHPKEQLTESAAYLFVSKGPERRRRLPTYTPRKRPA